MKKLLSIMLVTVFAVGCVGIASAQEKGKKGDKKKPTIEERFKKMDKDGNGKLTREEFVGKKKDEAKEKAEKRFDRADKDKDGSLTLEELKAARQKKGGKKGGGKKDDKK